MSNIYEVLKEAGEAHLYKIQGQPDTYSKYNEGWSDAVDYIESHIDEGWIPCSERLPRDLETVIVTWINRNPPSYYKDIKDKPISDVAYRYDGRWYWWTTDGIEAIKKYGRYGIYELDMVNDGIDIIAWMHMPEPCKEHEDE